MEHKTNKKEELLTLITTLIGERNINEDIMFKAKEAMSNLPNTATNMDLLNIASNISAYYVKTLNNQPIREQLLEEINKDAPKFQPEQVEYKTINNFTNIMNLMTKKSMLDVLRVFNPASLYKKVYIPLDNRNIAYSDKDGYKLTWYLSDTHNIQTGFVNIPQKLRDVVSIRLMNCYWYCAFPFVISRSIVSVGSDVLYDNDYSHRKFALCIEELKNQSFSTPSGLNHHFVGFYKRVYLNPVYTAGLTNIYRDRFFTMQFEEQFNYGTYTFQKPITLLDQISLSFNTMLYPIPLIDRTISLTVSYNGFIPFPGPISSIRIKLTSANYPFDQGYDYIMNVTLPDITTTDTVADAAWITAARASTFYLSYYVYNPTNPQVNISTGITDFTTIGTIILTTMNIPIQNKFYAELEATYIDSVI